VSSVAVWQVVEFERSTNCWEKARDLTVAIMLLKKKLNLFSALAVLILNQVRAWILPLLTYRLTVYSLQETISQKTMIYVKCKEL